MGAKSIVKSHCFDLVNNVTPIEDKIEIHTIKLERLVNRLLKILLIKSNSLRKINATPIINSTGATSRSSLPPITANNPEEVILWANITIPQDFDHWDSLNPLSVKLRAVEKENARITVEVYDTDKVKSYQLIQDYDSLTNDWVKYNLSNLVAGTWMQVQKISLVK